jgi:hypothetical protein
MSAYKQLLASDIIVTPFEVNKEFIFYGDNSLIDLNIGIDRLLGQNIVGTLFNPLSDPTTGNLGIQYQRLVYSSIKELYYSNYLSSSYGDTVNQPVLIPGRDEEGNRLVGSTMNPQFDNYLQTTLTYPKFFPTSSGAYIGVISIPTRLFGDYIKPNTFRFDAGANYLIDDGEGNILDNSNSIVGNIFYPHGIITITSASSTVNSFITDTNITCSFNSSYKIYETQYKCTIRENEYNLSLNPSIISGSNSASLGIPYGFITESYFSPYITTVGLYDEAQNLLAIGKLAQPLPSSPTTDTTILINIDR